MRIEAPASTANGEIDPEAGPGLELTPEQASTRTWRPDAETWAKIKRLSVKSPATITISGFADGDAKASGVKRQGDHFHIGRSGRARRSSIATFRCCCRPPGKRAHRAAAAARAFR
jgi:hypothetical protein